MKMFSSGDDSDILVQLTDSDRWALREAIKIAYQVSELGYLPDELIRLKRGEMIRMQNLYLLLSEPEED